MMSWRLVRYHIGRSTMDSQYYDHMTYELSIRAIIGRPYLRIGIPEQGEIIHRWIGVSYQPCLVST